MVNRKCYDLIDTADYIPESSYCNEIRPSDTSFCVCDDNNLALSLKQAINVTVNVIIPFPFSGVIYLLGKLKNLALLTM